MHRLLNFILFFILSIQLSAQIVYPIRSYTVLSPPLPYSLDGFVSETGKMNVNVIVDDSNLDHYAVKFRAHIKGNGIKLTTRPDLYQDPFYINGAETYTLTGIDFKDLLDPDNLIFEGYSKNEYKNKGRLPEGVYRIWFEVLDYYQNITVSRSTPAIAMIYLAKAPRLSYPLNGKKIEPDQSAMINFSWVSILPADPMANVRYRFKLYEIRPQGRDPYEITRVTQPIFQEECEYSNFSYGLGMPPLISGRSYAWRVEAFDEEERVLFQNNGLSDVLTFQYGKSCFTPEFSIQEVTENTVDLNWELEQNAGMYTIHYRKSNQDEDEWQEATTEQNKISLSGLEENTGYQVKMKLTCGKEDTDFTSMQEFKTLRNVDYTCGKKSNDFDLSNTDPLSYLGRFDEFKAADFIVEVEEAQGSDGNFSGSGYALVPYLGFVKFKVTFDNVFINTDRRMTKGEVKFVYDEATGLVVTLSGSSWFSQEEEEDYVENAEGISDQVIETDKPVQAIDVNGNQVNITLSDGTNKQYTLQEGEKVAIVETGKEGEKIYVADQSSGQVYNTPRGDSGKGKGTSAVGTASQTGEYGCSVVFFPSQQQRFGYDPVGKDKTKPTAYFQSRKTGEKMAWKSIQSGAADFIDLKIKGDSEADSLRFIRNSGLLTPTIVKGKQQQLLLTGLSDQEEDVLTIALANTQKVNDSTNREVLTEVGALGLVSYDQISKELVLVPVNGANCPQNAGTITKELNKIYASALVRWNVSIAPNLEVEDLKGKTFEHSGVSASNKYTSHMEEVITTFYKSSKSKPDKKTIYLFFIEEPTSSKTGFMPLAAQFGFIFNFNFQSGTRAIAHELGHAKDFNLRHTFSNKSRYQLQEKSTQNLMDHAGGKELWKYQWDLLHNPETIFFDNESIINEENKTDSTLNLLAGCDIKKGLNVQLGPIKISINSEPEYKKENNLCQYSVENTSIELTLNDQSVGQYPIKIPNVALNYTLDCSEGKLTSAQLTYKANSDIYIKDIGFIDASLDSIDLKVDSEGTINGEVNLIAQLNNDKNIGSTLVVKKGLSGKFKFVYDKSINNWEGNFNFEGVNSIELDILKGNEIFTTIKNAELDKNGKFSTEILIPKPISYREKGFNLTLKKFNGNIDFSLHDLSFAFRTLNAELSIHDIPGVNTELNMSVGMMDTLIKAQLNNLEDIQLYGITFEADNLGVSFNKEFELQQISGKNISATYDKSIGSKTLSGNIILKDLRIKNNQIDSIAGSGNVSCDPFANISLTSCHYNDQAKSIEFQANVDLAVNESNNLKTTINNISIFEDGSFEIGEISGDLQAEYGPVRLEFSKKLENSKKINKVDAFISINLKEGNVDKIVSFKSSVEYINSQKEGLSYLKIDADDLNIKFPSLYSIESKVKSVNFEYSKEDKENPIHKANITFAASLGEDKFVYKDLIKLKKGINGTISYSYHSKEDPLGTFDYGNIKGIKLQLIKEKKVAGTLNASITKDGLIRGQFDEKMSQPICYREQEFNITLKKISGTVNLNLQDLSFAFRALNADLSIHDIPGVNTELKMNVGMNDTLIQAKLSNVEDIQLYGITFGADDLGVSFNKEFELQQISGKNISATYDKSIGSKTLSGNVVLEDLLIKNNQIDKIAGSGNVSCDPFANISLTSCHYNDQAKSIEFQANVDLAANESNNLKTTINNISIFEDGSFEIGEVSGDLQAEYGPVKIEFSKKLENSKKIHEVDAFISINLKEDNVDKTISFKSSVKYINSQKEGLSYLKIDADGLNIKFPPLYSIDSKVKSVNFEYLKEKAIHKANITFAASLGEDKFVYKDLIKLKKGINGTISYSYHSKEDPLGTFDYGNIKGIKLQLIKEKKVAGTLNGSITKDGLIRGQFDEKMSQPICYREQEFNITLKKISGTVNLNLQDLSFAFRALNADLSIHDIPGVDTELNMNVGMNDTLIQAKLSNVEDIQLYGITFGADDLGVSFNKEFELQQISGKNISATYDKSIGSKTLSGNVILKDLLIKNNQIDKIAGSGSVSYDPFAKVSLTSCHYNDQAKSIEFQANVDLAANESNNLKTTINNISIFEDGSFEVGEISADLQAKYGPVKIEFSKKLEKSKKIHEVDALVSINLKEGNIDNTISFKSSVKYINSRKEGLSYLKIDTDDLNIKFPPLYSIESKVKSVNFEYSKEDNENPVHKANIILTAALEEDKFVHKNLIRLKKGISGTISYSYHSEEDPLGTFDYSDIKGIRLELIKEKKAAATFSGSIEKDGLITGQFKVDQVQEYKNAGFKTSLTKFDVRSSYHLKTKEFKFISGEGMARISEIKSLDGDLEVELSYLNDNFMASLSAKEQSLKFCKVEVSDLDLSFAMNSDLDISKIEGGFSIQPEGMSSKLKLTKVNIESGELKSLQVKGNVDYKNFKFDLLSGSYINNALTIDAKVLLGDSYVKVDKFNINDLGDISIGKVEGNIKKSLMKIKFNATFGDERFKGAFDATISKKLEVNGTVDMGSSECSTCEGGTFNFGYYALNVGAPIPVFPGVSISKLGGRFGYNYEIDFRRKQRFGEPKLDNHLIGLSFGLQDNAGLVELAVDPAIYQWGSEKATLSLTGTIKAPKINPIFDGLANINLDMPSYNIYGSLEAKIKIPAKSAYIVDANTKMQFEMNDKIKSFSSTRMSASILRVIDYQGSFSNVRKYNENGALIGVDGYLEGNLTYAFNYKKAYSGKSYSLDCNFDFKFESGLSTAFNDNGLYQANIYGSINAYAKIKASVLKCTFDPFVSVEGKAGLNYSSPYWKFNAGYEFKVGLESLGEMSFDGEYNKKFE